MSEWVEWHEGYRPGSQLAQRLRVVQDLIRGALDGCAPGPIRVISMCAGDGRDLLGVLEEHPRRDDVRARLVELDPELAARGRARAAGVSPSLEVVNADASFTNAYANAVPADIVLVCGVFGNVTEEDIERTVHHLPTLCAPAATVIWTRGTFEPDLDSDDPRVVRGKRFRGARVHRDSRHHCRRRRRAPRRNAARVRIGRASFHVPSIRATRVAPIRHALRILNSSPGCASRAADSR